MTLLLLVLGGCASGGRIVADNTVPLHEQVTRQTDQTETIAPPVLPPVKAAGTEKQTDKVLSEHKQKATPPIPMTTLTGAPQGVSDEEDDITKLLGPDDLQKFDIPIVFNDAVKYYMVWFTTEKRKVFGNWLRRARRYVPVITEILKEHGLPEDLVYLAMIESGFNPRAYSTAKACGPWQFIYETGGRYGLKVNNWIDERRDPEKSTVAAGKYLKDLFNQFGCWYLAAAGYNAGERRVERAIEKHNTNDFWELAKYNALPRETREYIPKLIAAAIIAKDPEKFGFGSMVYDPPLRFVEVKVKAATPLAAAAKAAGMDLDDLRALNPEIIRGITPPDMENYAIKLPYQVNGGEFKERLDAAISGDKIIKTVTTYKARKGDTQAKILKRFKLKPEEFALVNDCEGEMKVKPGTVVQIPKYGTSSAPQARIELADANRKEPLHGKVHKEKVPTKNEAGESQEPERVKGGDRALAQPVKDKSGVKPAYHVVKRGETLAGISSRYGLDMASIKSDNNLKGDRVYPNMKLRLASYVEKRKSAVKYHTVKRGDTLSTISGKYGIDIADIKSANKLKSDRLVPKMRLRIVEAEG